MCRCSTGSPRSSRSWRATSPCRSPTRGTRPVNLPLAFNANLAPAGTSADGRRLWSTQNRPDPRYGNIFVSASIGEQRYDGLVAVLSKRFSAGHSFQLSYHLSRANGSAFVNDFTGFGIFTSPSDPLNVDVDRGPSDFDMRNRFSATLVYEPQFALDGAAGTLLNNWHLSSRIIASDGFRFNGTTGQDSNGDTVFNDRPSGQTYNSVRAALLRHVRCPSRPHTADRWRQEARVDCRRVQPDQPAQPHQREPHVGAERHAQRQLQHADWRRDGTPVPTRGSLQLLGRST